MRDVRAERAWRLRLKMKGTGYVKVSKIRSPISSLIASFSK